MKAAAAFSSLMPAIAALVLICSGYASAQTTSRAWFVDDNAAADPAPNDPALSDPAEDGSAAHPFDAIQEAVDAASDGDAIIVRDGIYAGDVDLAGKAVYLGSVNGPGACVIDCAGGAGGPHRGFRFLGGESENTIISGFTIVNGYSTVGGAVYCGPHASPAIINNVITGNAAERDGGGIACDESSAPIIVNNVITNNSAAEGGGVHCAGSAPIIANTTIAGNTAPRGGGIACRGAAAFLNGCIVWGNAPGGQPQVALLSSRRGVSALSLTYSDVAAGQKGVNVEKGCTLDWGDGCISDDPMFADAAKGDFHLRSEHGRRNAAGNGAWETDKATSPCIDTGDPNADYSGEAQPDGFRANMGAYANTAEASRNMRWIIVGDADGDGVVSQLDINDVRSKINQDPSDKDYWKADLNRDGRINVLDLLRARNNLGRRKR